MSEQELSTAISGILGNDNNQRKLCEGQLNNFKATQPDLFFTLALSLLRSSKFPYNSLR